jgi:DNA-binding GntR family transcriptional regulator
VLDGILSGDAEVSRRTMDEHMDQTYQDYERYVHHTEP